MRVKCANCQMIFEKPAVHSKCVRCGSNASDPIAVKPREVKRQDETTIPSGPRLLLDDSPAPHNPLNG